VIPVVPGDRAALHTPHHDLLEHAGTFARRLVGRGIEAGAAGHAGSLRQGPQPANRISLSNPPRPLPHVPSNTRSPRQPRG